MLFIDFLFNFNILYIDGNNVEVVVMMKVILLCVFIIGLDGLMMVDINYFISIELIRIVL